jgi:hypothetical protein
VFSSVFTAVFENKRVFPVKFMAVAGCTRCPTAVCGLVGISDQGIIRLIVCGADGSMLSVLSRVVGLLLRAAKQWVVVV